MHNPTLKNAVVTFLQILCYDISWRWTPPLPAAKIF